MPASGGRTQPGKKGKNMPQYVVIASHDAANCPGANAKMKDAFLKLLPNLEGIGAKHGVKRISPQMHLDPTHQIMVILEAANTDAVMDALNENRIAQIQNCQVFRATPVEELFKLGDQLGQQPLY